MRLVPQLHHAILIVALLFGLQSCSSGPLFDIVLPRIDRSHGWSLDASGYLVYRESMIGPRLSIFVSPQLKSGHPLRIQLTFINGFEGTISLDSGQLVLEMGGQRYVPSATTCGPSSSNLGERVVTLQELSQGPRAPCMYLVFGTPQPDAWEKVSLRMNGLLKNGEKITVPEIKFYKTKRAASGSFA